MLPRRAGLHLADLLRAVGAAAALTARAQGEVAGTTPTMAA